MIKNVDAVGVTFVNTVLGRGIFNNVVNLQLGTYLFSEDEASQQITPDLVTTCRLRMDRQCAEQLYASLGQLLAAVAQAEGENTPDALQ